MRWVRSYPEAVLLPVGLGLMLAGLVAAVGWSEAIRTLVDTSGEVAIGLLQLLGLVVGGVGLGALVSRVVPRIRALLEGRE